MFIDPYATQLKWNTLSAFKGSNCDVWILFPLGGVLRMLPKNKLVEQDIRPLPESVSFVDRIVFGRTNYSKLASSYPVAKGWRNQRVLDVVAFCRVMGIDYFIKTGTWMGDESYDCVCDKMPRVS